MGTVIFRPSAHVDTFGKWSTEANAYNGDGTTSKAVLSANLAHSDATGSLILYGFPSSASYNLTSLTLYGMYNVDSKVSDDEFGFQASEDGGSNYSKDLLAMGLYTNTTTPLIPNCSVALSTAVNVDDCYVRVNLDMKKSADGATLNLFEIWAVGEWDDEIPVEPAGASGALTAADPDVEIVGSGAEVSPTGASAALSATGPTVVKGSVDSSPTGASGSLSATGPTVVKVGIDISPTGASGGLTAADPTTIKATVNIEPTAASGTLTAADPEVIKVTVEISPSGATGTLSATDPDVQLAGGGEEVFPTGATGALSAADPEVVKASIDISPAGSSGALSATDPIVVQASVEVSPGGASGSLSAADPVVVQVTIEISPPGASGSLSASGPIVVKGSAEISPAGASGSLSATDPASAIFTVYIYEIQSGITQGEEQAFDWHPGDDSETFKIEE